jgi:hypothetical protein
MIGYAPYAFGCLWAWKGLVTINDIWNKKRHTWRRITELSHQLGRKIHLERYEDLLTAIPNT